MSNNNKQSNNAQQQRQPAGSTHQPVQGRSTTQSTAPVGGQPQLWDNMNLPVGNPNAGLIDPRLVVQAVGPIRGLVPAQGPPPGSQQQQQGTGGQQSSQAMQGSNPGGYRSQPPAINTGQSGQASHPQGVRFRPPITQRGQQGQGGSASAGGGGPPPAYASGTVFQSTFHADPFRNSQRPQDGSGQSNRGQGKPQKRRG
ncbi:hypothetical protein BC826DRAFT_1183997 [Russula brevipes]|nr:hypothetical protein BC826DRAFT_1183997 [Russula brevipes]